jgi:hypothetical protein
MTTSRRDAASSLPDPAYLSGRLEPVDAAARPHAGLEFEVSPFSQRGGLPTPTPDAIASEMDRLLARHGHLLTPGRSD